MVKLQSMMTYMESGIAIASNHYANETVGDPCYPFDLLCRVIIISLETMKIVRALPPLEI